LRDDVRLLTLTGTGGTGKTRLALALAATLQDAFEDGIWFVDLSTITDATLVVPAIAHALSLRDAPQLLELQRVTAAIGDRKLLLVLDNFEQVVSAAADIAQLLAAAPRLKMLITSRAVLRVSGEHEFAVPSLGLPERIYPQNAEGLTQYEAVALFVQRAEAAAPGFQVTNANAPAIAEICARLDGLPLAIELAAARTKLLPPQALLGRLSNRLQLLTSGPRDRPERQQSLRRTIDWSYGLLDEPEKALFRQLAVFSGGWTLDAAEEVTFAQIDILDGLASLLDKSLIQQPDTTVAEPRYRMLETIREFAFEQLDRSGEAGDIRYRFADYFVRLAQAAELELRGPPSMQWLDRLQAEHDNLRAVVHWSLENREPTHALVIGGSLRRYMDARGHLNEAQRWLETGLGLDVPVAPRVRARALLAAGGVAWLSGDYALAIARNTESLTVYRGLADDLGVARALQNLGNVAHYQGEYDRATSIYAESLELYRKIGDQAGTAGILNSMGVLARNRGDLASARALGEESLSIHRSAGDARDVALGLNNLARVARDQGDWTSASDLCSESLKLFAELNDQWGVAVVLANLGIQAQRLGAAERAVKLFGASEALREAATGSVFLSVSPGESSAYSESVNLVRAALGQSPFAVGWRAGRELRLVEAVALGLPAEAGQGLVDAPPPTLQLGAVELTQREREVAVLIARGYTNRQIAEELVISEWTVDTHVRHIMNKLGQRSRAQVAVWVVEQVQRE
jgi:non-specific serine/threonine protein kinase